ncbi:MAG: dCMP deaminase family protein [Candidatus Gribaldobacteria bacterium]|nr:dCMP deaminase family protein [Candidatus Gribaldobacteria bacterium]
MRPTKEQYYLNIAKEIAQRSTCFRTRLGAIIVKDDAIVATGYNGAPRKTKDCEERGFCLRDKLKIPHGQRYELCRSVHAEMNCIINSARAGVSLLGGDLYLWAQDRDGNPIEALPCFVCKKMIINSGIKRFIGWGKEKNVKIYQIEDWAKEWQDKDIIDDKEQYGADQNLTDKVLNNGCSC